MSRGRQAATLAALVIVFAVVQFGDGPDVVPPAAPIDIPAPGEEPDAVRLAVPITGESPGTMTGNVVHVTDGDTFRVELTGDRAGEVVTIRFLRIDTPELARDGSPAECWALEATDALEALTPVGSRVTLQYDEERQDQYGRDLAHVWNETGVWVNGRMLLDGHARVATFRPNVAHDGRVRELEQIAIQRGAGLWGTCLR